MFLLIQSQLECSCVVTQPLDSCTDFQMTRGQWLVTVLKLVASMLKLAARVWVSPKRLLEANGTWDSTGFWWPQLPFVKSPTLPQAALCWNPLCDRLCDVTGNMHLYLWIIWAWHDWAHAFVPLECLNMVWLGTCICTSGVSEHDVTGHMHLYLWSVWTCCDWAHAFVVSIPLECLNMMWLMHLYLWSVWTWCDWAHAFVVIIPLECLNMMWLMHLYLWSVWRWHDMRHVGLDETTYPPWHWCIWLGHAPPHGRTQRT